MPDVDDTGGDPGLELFGLARDGNEGAGRLVACDLGCEFFRISCRLKEIGEADHSVGWIAHRWFTGMMTSTEPNLAV